MLQVRANSWHYWVWRLGRSSSSTPKNLCRYFWHCVFKIVATLVITFLVFAGVAALLILIGHYPVFFGMGVVGLTLAVLLFIGAGYLVGMWVDRRLRLKPERQARRWERQRLQREAEEARKNKPPGTLSLVWTFIKAKKAKYCPLIQVVDK